MGKVFRFINEVRGMFTVKKPTVAVINHGCKLNQFEGESIAYSLERAGFEIIETGTGEAHPEEQFNYGDTKESTVPCRNFLKGRKKPDIIIVNTCTVTGKSDRKSRHSVLQASRLLAKGGKLVVTGCYAETNPDELRKIGGVDLVIGTRGKALIPDILCMGYGRAISPFRIDVPAFDFRNPEPHRSRVFVKVQDGCNMHCSYCKVPYARGPSQSRSVRDVVDNIREIIANGYHEVVLTGVNLGSYNYSGKKLAALIARIFEEIEGDYRMRLSSIEPVYFTDDLLQIISQCPNITPHFHIPLQSGSDRLLRLMKRPYRANKYLDIVGMLRDARPDCHIAADVIVGFPTETADDFEATERIIRESECASIHVFRYSPREGSAAAGMQDDVSYQEKSARSRRLIELGRTLNYRYRKRFLKTKRDTIVQQRKDRCEGITDNYIRVQLPSISIKQAQRCNVQIIHADEKRTIGKIVS